MLHDCLRPHAAEMASGHPRQYSSAWLVRQTQQDLEVLTLEFGLQTAAVPPYHPPRDGQTVATQICSPGHHRCDVHQGLCCLNWFDGRLRTGRLEPQAAPAATIDHVWNAFLRLSRLIAAKTLVLVCW